MVIGGGSVGKVICSQIAQLHPRSLTIVDPAALQDENLLNQCITPDAIGSNKAEYVGQWCAQMSPNTRVPAVYAGRTEDLPLAALCLAAEIVMLATDNLGVEVDVAQRCLHAGVPLVQASVAGEFLVAQIRFCGNTDGTGPCLACGFGPSEWQHVNQTIFSCEGGDLDDAQPQPANLAATRSTSSLCSLAADLAMMQVLRHLGGLGRAGGRHTSRVLRIHASHSDQPAQEKKSMCSRARALATGPDATRTGELYAARAGEYRTRPRANGGRNLLDHRKASVLRSRRLHSMRSTATSRKVHRHASRRRQMCRVRRRDGRFAVLHPSPHAAGGIRQMGRSTAARSRRSLSRIDRSAVMRRPNAAVLCEFSAQTTPTSNSATNGITMQNATTTTDSPIKPGLADLDRVTLNQSSQSVFDYARASSAATAYGKPGRRPKPATCWRLHRSHRA